MDDIIDLVNRLDGVLTLRPHPGDGSPDIAWGDVFFYYAPDGVVPQTQPFATIVTKNYPDDTASRLDRPDAFRVNIAAGKTVFTERMGFEPKQAESRDIDYAVEDVLVPHPVYARQGWLAVVNPATTPLEDLLETAYRLQRDRLSRQSGTAGR